jgi:fermentation-respiration switch protein FrsA (DUF1100 family)
MRRSWFWRRAIVASKVVPEGRVVTWWRVAVVLKAAEAVRWWRMRAGMLVLTEHGERCIGSQFEVVLVPSLVADRQ